MNRVLVVDQVDINQPAVWRVDNNFLSVYLTTTYLTLLEGSRDECL